MADGTEKAASGHGAQDLVLKGTALAVFRYIFKQGRPIGPREIERGLGLSSVSLASYHLAKLLEAGLIHETPEGYVVNKRMHENVIRVKRMLIPAQISYVAFFVTLEILLLTVFHPTVLYPAYYLSLVGILGAVIVSVFEAKRAAGWKV